MYLDGSLSYLLNLRDTGTAELNGRTSLTVEFFYKPNVTLGPADSNYNILSSSGSATPVDSNVALSIGNVANDRIVATLNVGGTTYSIGTPNNAVQKGTTYHVALTYDGSTIRLFLNGTLKTSTSATGTIHQLACEDFLPWSWRVAGWKRRLITR